LRKVALQKYRVEKERLQTFERFGYRSPTSAANVLTAVSGVRENSLSNCASKEAEELLGGLARSEVNKLAAR
jgi:hypothetical protein